VGLPKKLSTNCGTWCKNVEFVTRPESACSDRTESPDPAELDRNFRILFKKADIYMTGMVCLFSSVPDPDPPDPHFFGPPGSGSISQRYGSGSGSVGILLSASKNSEKNLDSYCL
jgi:hypothetical protein